MARNDVFRHTTASGGGWGNPVERDRRLIAADLRRGRVTRFHVETEYGAAAANLPAGDWVGSTGTESRESVRPSNQPTT